MKKTTLTVATAPKTSTFQMRINPEIKAQVEGIYAQCGMTLTDAINAFIQQSINVEGMPFLVTANSKQALREQAISQLMIELDKGEKAPADDSISEEDILKEYYNLQTGNLKIKDFLAKYKFTYLVLSDSDVMFYKEEELIDYKLVYSEKNYKIYIRK